MNYIEKVNLLGLLNISKDLSFTNKIMKDNFIEKMSWKKMGWFGYWSSFEGNLPNG